ncbi:aminodeoxychorismate/anthranilate synthase component II [Corynebacterium heidelbergense]|uniref:Aminodeoxychorismate/anthranilate synthase component II n=1 Tax=Corynebacterium heidelbergense TaxID=2055947 RepID=A0A364V6N5_9CORY|nr:aminodeoxychorismate/anthranilate synthase component II [Corynebacterium heidelbergense]RAV32281.1 aminodeoxychorismate/anthranilate synthase component II [Corynebacterium heidelbergense]
MRILVVDNFDSFVYNLVQYVGQLGLAGENCVVWRNNAPELGENPEEVERAVGEFDAVLLSPGPGEPAHAGWTMEIVRACAARRIPLFGVCLGHQAIGHHFGGSVVRAQELFHGKTSPVTHDGSGVMRGIPSPCVVTRYHSLTVDPATLPEELVVTGRVESGMIMSMRHRDLPIHSVQFHPESVMTQYGHRMLANWLAEAGYAVPEAVLAEVERAQLELTGSLQATVNAS